MSAPPPYGGFTTEQINALASNTWNGLTQFIQARYPPHGYMSHPHFAGLSQYATLYTNGALPPGYPHSYWFSSRPEDHPANRELYGLFVSSPVRKFTSLDEITLVDKIREGNRSYKSLLEIMESLSNVNGHTSVEWADYFLQNSTRITGLTVSDPLLSSSVRSERNPLSIDSTPVPQSSKSLPFKARRSRTPMRALSILPSRRGGPCRESASEKEDHGTPPVEKVRMSKRLHARTSDVPDDNVSLKMASDEEEKYNSPLTDPPPSLARLVIPHAVEVKPKCRRSSSPASCPVSQRRPVAVQQSKLPVAGFFRSAPISTLFDTDVMETSKRKHDNSEKEDHDASPFKKVRMSKRLIAKKSGVQDDIVSSQMASDEKQSKNYSSLADLMPCPVGLPIPHSVAVKLKRCRSPSPASRPASKRRSVLVQQSKLSVAGSSRSAPSSVSRPGHRLPRDPSTHSSQAVPTRTFPASLPIISGYSSFYRRYPLVTQFHQDDPVGQHVNPIDTLPKRTIGNWNPPREYRDLYTARYTKGRGDEKLALCPICFEEPARGGEGRQEWNHTKTSQHNYHMQYYHGISANRCAPFSPPIAQRISPLSRPQTNEKSEILQGKCHVCEHWIALEGCKIGELKVKELLWWKHAAQCHKDSKLAGEEDIFIEDDAYRLLKEYEVAHPPQEA